jgi:hypothetical protein
MFDRGIEFGMERAERLVLGKAQRALFNPLERIDSVDDVENADLARVRNVDRSELQRDGVAAGDRVRGVERLRNHHRLVGGVRESASRLGAGSRIIESDTVAESRRSPRSNI